MPEHIYVLASHIYRIVSTGFAPDYGKAAAVGMSALSASVVLIYMYRRLTSRTERYVTVTGRGYKPSVIDLKSARWSLFGAVGSLCLILAVVPVVVLFYVSLLPWSVVPGPKAIALMSLKNWTQVLRTPSVLDLGQKQFLTSCRRRDPSGTRPWPERSSVGPALLLAPREKQMRVQRGVRGICPGSRALV